MKRSLKIGGGIVCSLLVVLSSTLGGFIFAYKDAVYPNIKIGPLSVSGLSQADAAQALQEKVDAYENLVVDVIIPDRTQPADKTTGAYPSVDIKTTAGNLGLTFNQQNALDAAWQIGHTSQAVPWLGSTVHTLFKGNPIALTYQVDPAKVSSFMSTEVVPKITTPTAATIQITNGTVKINDAKPGLVIDTKTLTADLVKALPRAVDGDPIFLTAPVQTQDSPITRSTLEPLAQELTTLGATGVTLKNGTITLRPSASDVLSWYTIVQDDTGKLAVAVNNQTISDYLTANAGTTLDVTKSLPQVTAALTTQMTTYETSGAAGVNALAIAVTQKPVAAPDTSSGSYTVGKFAGDYIEVNLKEQKLYRMHGDTLEKVYGVSSGKWSTPTPLGTFTIIGKAPKAFSSLYGLYMPYWMNFAGTAADGRIIKPGLYGIHELPIWPSGYQEGVGHIGTPVSDGCIRLDNGDAAEMYSWAQIGTPVIIF